MVLHTRRRFLRHAMPTQCVVLSRRRGRLLGEGLVDVSPEGLLVHGDGSTAIYEPVDIALRVPLSRIWITGQAVVARVVRGRRHGDAFEGLGLILRRMDDRAREMLVRSMRHFPPTGHRSPAGRDYAGMVARIAGRPEMLASSR